jgi:hypothetical protein
MDLTKNSGKPSGIRDRRDVRNSKLQLPIVGIQ